MNKNDKVLQFKITLNDSKPKIWRRISVSAGASFFDLHVAIQDAMGWSDSHLHKFSIFPKDKKASALFIQFPDPDFEDDFIKCEVRDERFERISEYFGVSIKQCIYEYDFGDGWEHMVLFEKELPAEQKAKYPQCTGGQNACPFEDSGGIWGYEEKLKILKNPKHLDHKDILEWLDISDPSEADPARFDVNEVAFRDSNKILKEYEKGFGISHNKRNP